MGGGGGGAGEEGKRERPKAETSASGFSETRVIVPVWRIARDSVPLQNPPSDSSPRFDVERARGHEMMHRIPPETSSPKASVPFVSR